MGNRNKGSFAANAILIERKKSRNESARERSVTWCAEKAPPGFAGRGVEKSVNLELDYPSMM